MDHDNRIRDQDAPVHRWYQFILAYPPHFVQEYITAFNIQSGMLVYDPFVGTGTTAVECMKQNVDVIGTDANPMSWYAAKVKTTWNVDIAALKDDLGYLYQSYKLSIRYHHIYDDMTQLVMPKTSHTPQISHRVPELTPDQQAVMPVDYISPMPLQKALLLAQLIRDLEDEDRRSFFNLALGQIIAHDISNVRYGPDISLGIIKKDADVWHTFYRQIMYMISDLTRFQKIAHGTARIWYDDARVMRNLQGVCERKVDAVITSPPYPNEKDYSRMTRMESVILGLVNSKSDLSEVKDVLLHSNSRGIRANDPDEKWVEDVAEVQALAHQIEAKCEALGKTSGFERSYGKVIRQYYGGMAKHLHAILPFLKPHAQLVYLVGDQQGYFQIHNPVAELLGIIATRYGYAVKKIEPWRTRFASGTSQWIDENVLILMAP